MLCIYEMISLLCLQCDLYAKDVIAGSFCEDICKTEKIRLNTCELNDIHKQVILHQRYIHTLRNATQCLSQDLETGCPKLAIEKFWGVQIFKGITIYSDFNYKHVSIHQNKA